MKRFLDSVRLRQFARTTPSAVVPCWIFATIVAMSGPTQGQSPSALVERVRESRERPDLVTPPSATVYRSGIPFTRAMQEPVVGWTLKRRPLRDVLQTIRDERRVAVLLDRRLNPDRLIDADFAGQTLEETLELLAAAIDARLKVVGSVACLVPHGPAESLRTLVQLRYEETHKLRLGDAVRYRQLRRASVLRWGDATPPRQVLSQLAARFDLAIEGLEAVPHDLWGRGALVGVSAAEGLQLILHQLQLTFDWSSDFRSVAIEPITGETLLVRRYAVQPQEASDQLEALRDVAGVKRVTTQGNTLVVASTLEAHEAIDRLRRGDPGSTGTTADGPKFPPLTRRSFSLTVRDAPVSAIMRKLEMTGVKFEFNAAQLADAGIDLDAKVDVDVQGADAQEFLGAMFKPIGVQFRVDGLRVLLSPGS